MFGEDRVFEPVVQKSTNDCVIACLSMYLGIPYATVREAAPKRLGDGLSTRQLINVAKRLGYPLELRKKFTSKDIGIVDLWRDKKSRYGESGHVAVYIRGTVWTTASGGFWPSLRTYAKNHDFDVEGLITHADNPKPDPEFDE